MRIFKIDKQAQSRLVFPWVMLIAGLLGIPISLFYQYTAKVYDQSEGVDTFSKTMAILSIVAILAILALIPITLGLLIRRNKGALRWIIGFILSCYSLQTLVLSLHPCPLLGPEQRKSRCAYNERGLWHRLSEMDTADQGRHTLDFIWTRLYNQSDFLFQWDCPSELKNQEKSYSLNQHVCDLMLKEVPSDIVVLFECRRGAGPTGGAEDVGLDHHKTGVNILFGDGHV